MDAIMAGTQAHLAQVSDSHCNAAIAADGALHCCLF